MMFVDLWIDYLMAICKRFVKRVTRKNQKEPNENATRRPGAGGVGGGKGSCAIYSRYFGWNGMGVFR